MSAVSPLAPARFPDLPAIGGVRLGVHEANLRYHGRDDLFVALMDEGTTAAGTLTRSLCPSAPVDWCRRILPRGSARALVVNAGNANAFTGSAGAVSARRTAETVAAAHDLSPDDVFLASTGVIGEPLPDDALAAGLRDISIGEATWRSSADAIRTTDTFAKGATAAIGDTGASVVGIAKGSGMIAPDMATMLAFVFTDAAVPASTLQEATARAVEVSFNRITVDSDTSTSDTVLVFATGATGVDGADHGTAFDEALEAVMLDLAHQIVRDGEGATKFIEVRVTGAAGDDAAATIARSIADSPLVKTAVAAGDANWGRIVMAVGKAGEKADRDSLRIVIGDELVAERGRVAVGYDESRAARHLAGADVVIAVDVGVGAGAATVWTCDLTHGYIEINAGYRS